VCSSDLFIVVLFSVSLHLLKSGKGIRS
jgi:hypothetical protein